MGNKTNDELNKLIRNKNISSYIMAQRLSWFGHVHRITNNRMVKKLYEWKLIYWQEDQKLDGKMISEKI